MERRENQQPLPGRPAAWRVRVEQSVSLEEELAMRF